MLKRGRIFIVNTDIKKSQYLVCLIFHGKFYTGILRVDKVEERYSVMFSIEKAKGVINIASIKMNSWALILIKPYVFITS